MPTPLRVRDCLCLHARRTARQLTQLYDDALRPTGLRITQFLLLAAIREAQPIAHQALADILGMDRTTLTRNLAIVERDGLVAITKGLGDKRESQIRLTPVGDHAVQSAMPHWEQAQQLMLERLAPVLSPSSGLQALALLDRIGSLAATFESVPPPQPRLSAK
jgi:DNA-binding MarR family transcriptional regulator